ncbi:MAG: hypothetical protein ACO3JL_14775 [Myxococcota bacterium]
MKNIVFLVFLAAAPGAAREPAPAAPRVTSPQEEPGANVPSIPWEDPARKLRAAAAGGVGVCEAVAFPLTLVPGVGSIASSVVDWACLVPAALAVDYVGTFHAGSASHLWQPLLALVAAKVYRSMVFTAGVAVMVGAGLLFTGGVTAALVALGAPYYLPVALTGVLTGVGVTFLATRALERWGSDALFGLVYGALASPLRTPEEHQAAETSALIAPPLGPFARAFALLAAASGAEPASEPRFAIPVAGPLYKSAARAEVVEQATLRVGTDILHEAPASPAALHRSAVVTSFAEGALGAAGHALLLGGAGILLTGTLMAALTDEKRGDTGEYATWAAGVGGVGVVIAGGGVACVLLRQVPRVLRAVLVPAAFGLWPAAAAEEP